MKIVLTVLAGFLAAVVVTWMLADTRILTDYLVIVCAFMLGALVNELMRGEG